MKGGRKESKKESKIRRKLDLTMHTGGDPGIWIFNNNINGSSASLDRR
jgi:hypothetical protein